MRVSCSCFHPYLVNQAEICAMLGDVLVAVFVPLKDTSQRIAVTQLTLFTPVEIIADSPYADWCFSSRAISTDWWNHIACRSGTSNSGSRALA